MVWYGMISPDLPQPPSVHNIFIDLDIEVTYRVHMSSKYVYRCVETDLIYIMCYVMLGDDDIKDSNCSRHLENTTVEQLFYRGYVYSYCVFKYDTLRYCNLIPNYRQANFGCSCALSPCTLSTAWGMMPWGLFTYMSTWTRSQDTLAHCSEPMLYYLRRFSTRVFTHDLYNFSELRRCDLNHLNKIA